jgi:MFS family permease
VLLSSSPTELTTSATDAVLAIECAVIMAYLWRRSPAHRWRTAIWCWVFGLQALSSFLGAVAHGFILPASLLTALWRALYLSLGVLVALFLVGAVLDWRGRKTAARLVPWSIGTGAAFLVLTELLSGGFMVFIVYEATVMLLVLAVYLYLSLIHRLKGAGFVAAAVVLTMIAAGVQANEVSVHLLFPFDHNGVFHLVQMAATAMLGAGLAVGMRPGTQDTGTPSLRT